jgi:hypothetical protein
MATLKGTGTQDRKKVAIAAALGIVVVLLAIRTIFGGPAAITPGVPAVSAPAALHPATVPAGPRRSGVRAGGALPVNTNSLDPQLHPELMAENENYRYNGNGRNIFSQTSSPVLSAAAIEKLRAPIRPSLQTASVQTGPPPPPAINLKFFGYTTRRSGMRRAFLMHGDDVFVASEGDIVSHRYKVVSIAPFSIQVEDLPYHDTQTLPLTQN